MDRLVLTLLLIAITAVWGWTFSLVKDAIEAYCVIGFLTIRFAIGSAALAGVVARRITVRSLVVGGLIGVVVAVAHLLQTFGLRYTTATNCGLITGLFAVFAPLANRLLFGVRILPLFWAAAGLSVVGLFLLTGAGPSPPNLGDVLALGCAVSLGIHIAMLDRFTKQHDPLALTFVQLAAATIIFLAVWPVAEPVRWPSGTVWLALIVTGVVATAAGFYIQVLAQRRIPAVRAAIILSLEPVFAAFFGFLLAGDRLTGVQFTGAILMFAAVVVSEVFPAQRPATTTQNAAPIGRSWKILAAAGFAAVLLLVGLVYARMNFTQPAHDTTAGPPDSTIAKDRPSEVTKAESEQERSRRMVLGTWADEYQGKRTMTLNADGTGTMVVELSGWRAALSAPRLKFNMKWSVEAGHLKKQTISGEPEAQVNMILKMMGDRVDEPILELTEDRLLLLDGDGKTKYQWKRVRK